MPTVQQMLEIAMRHATAMADAMIIACFAKANEDGYALILPGVKAAAVAGAGERPAEDVDWARMVAQNSDTRHNHC